MPSITGAAQHEAALTASPGTWTGTQPMAFAYRWQRCNSAGASCSTISGAQQSTYTVVSADVNATLRVAVTASNSAGASTATSAATAVVTRRPSNTALPRISGTARDGQRLTASAGSWTGTPQPTFGYAWQRCNSDGGACAAIAGETSTTYAVRPADIGKRLRVSVTATNSAGTATATSNPTSIVSPIPPQDGSVVALWHMDETVGSTMFDSAGGHHGTLHSGVQLGQPGFAGLAYRLSGPAHVSVPNSPALQAGSSDITITMRIKTTGVPSSGDWELIRNGIYETPGGEHKMELYPSGQASCGFNGSSGYSELTTGPRLDDGVWHTVQCVKTSSSIQVVVDGQVFSRSASIGSIFNTDPITIGTRPDGGGEPFQGLIDEASIRIG
ncbi:MAG TPA: LamG-like jellyroll fold domain-containing protein [Solirubrobacteraceae bacterium]|nr:LamG-like jellyroll fold domain-containing protein [Solirubrobacteraceae bacterium]